MSDSRVERVKNRGRHVYVPQSPGALKAVVRRVMHDQRRSRAAGIRPKPRHSLATVAEWLPKIAAAVNAIVIATMTTKQKEKSAETAKGRGGHLRSKVEKRDDDIIHVRPLAGIPIIVAFQALA